MMIKSKGGFAAPALKPFPFYDPSTQLSEKEHAQLRQKFAYLDPKTIKNPLHYILCTQCDNPDWYAVAEYNHGSWCFAVMPEEEIPEDLLPVVERAPIHRGASTVSPNAPCPCGSGKKKKRCCY